MKTRSFIVLFFVFVLIGCASVHQPVSPENIFHSPTAGFTITKPDSWVFLSVERIAENRVTVRMKDEELQELMRKNARLPLVAMARHPEPYDDLNPSVQVLIRPLGQLEGTPPTDILSVAFVPLKNAFEDFKVIRDIHETEIGGMKAASVKMTYRVSIPDGRSFRTVSTLWVIPRGKYMFMLSTSVPPERETELQEDFRKILSSIRIER